MIDAMTVTSRNVTVSINSPKSRTGHLDTKYMVEVSLSNPDAVLTLNPNMYGDPADDIRQVKRFYTKFLDGMDDDQIRRIILIGSILNNSSEVARFNRIPRSELIRLVKFELSRDPFITRGPMEYTMLGMGPEPVVMELARTNTVGLLRKRQLIPSSHR